MAPTAHRRPHRAAAAALCCVLATAHARAQPATSIDAGFKLEQIRLWPDHADPAPSHPQDAPSLTVFPPRAGFANGTAVIIAPGGAYKDVALDFEGRVAADWFAARGMTAFVLRYRLGLQYPFPTPLLDAQRAVRLVRTLAPRYGIDPHRIGFLGFSSGGHLAAIAALAPNLPPPAAADATDRQSAAVNFAILAYPWLNAMEQQRFGGRVTYCTAIPGFSPTQCAQFEKSFDPKNLIAPGAPPFFIFATVNDELIPVEANLEFAERLSAVDIPYELHLFQNGRHGAALGHGDPALDTWTTLLEQWLRTIKMMPPTPP